MTDELKLTRRGWLQGVTTAAGVAVGTACKPGTSDTIPQGQPGAVTPEVTGERVSVAFTLDGEELKLEVETRDTLLDALRFDLDQTGTKRVCDRGACGACMVLVDGRPHNSCMMLAADVDGAKVETVAGLSARGELSALQAAFVAQDATQCGFCTSGMLISCTALLRRGGALDAKAIRRGISGNLCRCGTYPNVVQAVLSASKGAKPA